MEIHLTKSHGMQFYAEPLMISSAPTRDDGCAVELVPKRNELYVICLDGSVQAVFTPDRQIGWVLMEAGDGWFYSASRTHESPKPCFVRYHATSENPPKGNGFCNVTEATPECQGAPVKPPRSGSHADNINKIARNLNPDLAAAAEFVGDPVQTEALAKFSEGKMSYAEMRGLCG